MKQLIDKILTEWAYRVYDGMPNIKNPTHLVQLKNSLKHLKINEDAIDYLMNKLYENDVVKNKKSGNQYVVKTHNSDTQDLVVKDASKEDIEKVEKGEEVDDKTDSQDTSTMTDEQAEKEAEDNKVLDETVKLILLPRTDSKGFGVNRLSRKDAEAFHKYLLENSTPQGKKEWEEKERKRQKELEKKNGPVTDERVDEVINKMKPNSEEGKDDPEYKKTKALYDDTRNKIIKKGGPGSKYTTGTYPADHPKYPGQSIADVRYRNIIKLYIKTGGICPITGEKIPLQDMELDHVVSLDNGGLDEPDNWMLTKRNINQFKGAKKNPAIQADLQEQLAKSKEERESEKAQNDLKNFEKKETREYWKLQSKKGYTFTKGQLDSMSKKELDSVVVGINESTKEDDTLTDEEKKTKYIKRNQSRNIMLPVKGKDKPIKLSYTRGSGVVRPVKEHPESWGLKVNPETKKIEKNPKYKNPNNDFETAYKYYKDDRGSGGQGLPKDEQINEIQKQGLVTDESVDKRVNEEVDMAIANQPTRKGAEPSPEKKEKLKKSKEADASVKDRQKAGDDSTQQKKNVTKKMNDWLQKHPAPRSCHEDPTGKTAMDKGYSPVEIKIPVDKKGKPTKEGKEIKCYQEWEEMRDKQRNYYWNQEYYQRKFDKRKDYKESVE